MNTLAHLPISAGKILFVDDEELSKATLTRSLNNRYEVFVAKNVVEAKLILDTNADIHVVVADQRMPGQSGLDLLEIVLKIYPKMVRIISTAYSDYNVIIDAINSARVFGYIDKPWNMERLNSLLERSLEYYYSDNREQGLMRIASQDAATPLITISRDSLSDVETILKLMSSVAPSASKKKDEIKFTIRQEDDDIVIGCHAQTGIDRFVSLSEFRERAGRISNSESDSSVIDSMFTGDFALGETSIAGPKAQQKSTLAKGVKHKENVDVIRSDSRTIQIKKTSDELVFFLMAIRQAYEALSKREKIEIKNMESKLEKLVSAFRDISECDLIEREKLYKTIAGLGEILQPFEVGKEPYRSLVVGGNFSESVISGLFVSHNMFATLLGKSVRHPNSSMILLAKGRENNGSNNALLGFSLLLFLPAVFVLFGFMWKSPIPEKIQNLLIFISLVGAALLSAMATHKGMGKMNIDHKINLGKDNYITMAATGALAVFLFVVIFGTRFIFENH